MSTVTCLDLWKLEERFNFVSLNGENCTQIKRVAKDQYTHHRKNPQLHIAQECQAVEPWRTALVERRSNIRPPVGD